MNLRNPRCWGFAPEAHALCQRRVVVVHGHGAGTARAPLGVNPNSEGEEVHGRSSAVGLHERPAPRRGLALRLARVAAPLVPPAMPCATPARRPAARAVATRGRRRCAAVDEAARDDGPAVADDGEAIDAAHGAGSRAR